jgi:hypothetical protein
MQDLIAEYQQYQDARSVFIYPFPPPSFDTCAAPRTRRSTRRRRRPRRRHRAPHAPLLASRHRGGENTGTLTRPVYWPTLLRCTVFMFLMSLFARPLIIFSMDFLTLERCG